MSNRPRPAPRPDRLDGRTYRTEVGCGKMYVTVSDTETSSPFEVFARLGKAGGCAASQNEAISRLVSLCLRAGITPETIQKHLIGISCHLNAIGLDGERTSSCSDAIGKVLRAHERINQHLVQPEPETEPEAESEAEDEDPGNG
jgi:ribonucleoside-diphosphate reductase alpha chain